MEDDIYYFEKGIFYEMEEFQKIKKDKVYIECKWFPKSLIFSGKGYVEKREDEKIYMTDSFGSTILCVDDVTDYGNDRSEWFWDNDMFIRIYRLKKNKFCFINEK